jgi:tol-pal system protein YbgF
MTLNAFKFFTYGGWFMKHFALLLAGTLMMLMGQTAHAGLFDDAQARKAILDLREKVGKLTEQQQAREVESAAAQEQISQLKRNVLDIHTQLESLQSEAAKLRGQNEQLTQEVVELQRIQKDSRQAALDDRNRKADVKTVNVDGKEFVPDPEEQRQFDEAFALVRKADYAKAITSFSTFQKRYPSSNYNDSVLLWTGNALYAKRDYREAITSFRALVSSAPGHPSAPEALLSVASCQAELRDTKGARRTLEELLRQYPKAEAAVAAKERLATLK